MRHVIQIFGSKVVLAILGALIVGGVSAGLAAGTALRPHSPAPGVASTNGATNPTATTSAQPTATATPTDTPTTAPQTGPTATPNGQTTLRGTISALPPNEPANTFLMSTRNGNRTVMVDGNTSYQNGLNGFGDLQIGGSVIVTATLQPDGTTYLATKVTGNNDN
ncbi:MAG TPA: hypothetical protein VMV29_00390 [Ktedonobacterales bacterium]|nr:hypothetical protein [Ktedonobacterales bacterium]